MQRHHPANIETEHSVRLQLSGLSREFRITAEVRAVILRYAKKLIDDILSSGGDAGDDPPIRLLLLSYVGRMPGRPHDVPMLARLLATRDVSSYALSFLLDALCGAQWDMVRYLRRLDSGNGRVPNAFRNVRLDTGTYDPEDVTLEETATPPPRPSRLPSRRSSRRPMQQPTFGKDVQKRMTGRSTNCN